MSVYSVNSLQCAIFSSILLIEDKLYYLVLLTDIFNYILMICLIETSQSFNGLNRD